MSEQTSQITKMQLRSAFKGLNRWSIGAVLIAMVVLIPILSVIWIAFHPTENIWPHLISTTLPRYLWNTLILMTGVGVLTAAIGTGAAWLVVMYDFPGRRWLQWALLMPLAVPAYVGAYALVDFLEYAGPVQTSLRAMFGWENARSYWFPEIRSRGAAILVLSMALYPYVYILARAAFREQSSAGYDVARALGAGPIQRFIRVGLPLARPAIAAGSIVAMMETINDFGTVDYFSVQTLTTGIFSTWFHTRNVGGAAQIASLALTLIVICVLLERYSRRKSRFFQTARNTRPVQRFTLRGLPGMLGALACFIPFAFGFLMPVLVLLTHAENAQQWAEPGLVEAIIFTVSVGGVAATLTVLGGLFMVYGVRLSPSRLPRLLMPVTAIGYAAPGAVLGLGILVPLAHFDNALADFILAITGFDPGLIFTGTAFALVLAYFVRFFAISQGAADAALGRVSPSLSMAARSLGRGAGQTLRHIHMPLIRGSIGSALLLVFVDCVKELPATILLRGPFGRDTLATRVHEKASLENLTEAAPAALMICLVGLFAVALLARANR